MYNNRRNNRLQNYNYSQLGYYFITICTENKKKYFGDIVDGKMILNEYGKIIETCWHDLPNHYNCDLDTFIIMPNHFHGIVIINDIVGTGLKPVPTAKHHSLSEIVRGLKTFSSRKINALNSELFFSWQRSFYDHVVRRNESLEKIREYIINNPLKWELDEYNVGTGLKPVPTKL